MSEKHNIPVTFRMNIREREALRRISSIEGRKPSEMMRELVREAAQRRGLWQIQTTSRPANQPSEQPG